MAKSVVETQEKSSKMAQLLEKVDFAPKTFAKSEKVEGKIVSKIGDSLLIDIGAKAEANLAIKELEDEQKDLKIGDKISAFVAQPENDSGIIILSAKKGLKDKVWEYLQGISEKGEVVDVKAIETNRGGLIVDYNGTRGFIPSSHLVTNAKDALGKKLFVKPLEVNKNFNKLVFSEKEVVGETLPKIELPFKVGDILGLAITKILPFGLLVALKGGGDGLIHISEISWTRVEGLQQIYKVDQKIKAKVISIEPSSGRVNLSIKQLEKDPWGAAAKHYKVGTVIKKKVSRTTNYGVFIGLEEGIEGLLHSSKIPYGMHLKPGDEVKISIDLFDSEQKRVALRLAVEEKSEDNKVKDKKASTLPVRPASAELGSAGGPASRQGIRTQKANKAETPSKKTEAAKKEKKSKQQEKE